MGWGASGRYHGEGMEVGLGYFKQSDVGAVWEFVCLATSRCDGTYGQHKHTVLGLGLGLWLGA